MIARIGVVAAIRKELGALLAQMRDESAVMRGGRAFRIGHLEGRDIVVVADALLQRAMDALPLFPRHQVPLHGANRFAAGTAMSAAVAMAARSAVPEATLHRGLVVSGDRFVATAAESAALRERLPAALAVEVEGAALAQVRHDFGLPFAVARTTPFLRTNIVILGVVVVGVVITPKADR